MKRFLCMLLTLVMVLSVPMVGITSVAADATAAAETAETALTDQLSVIGSYADSTEEIKQADVGMASTTEIYPSPEATSVRNPNTHTFLLINMKNYSGQWREDGKDMPLDDNFFYSLRTTLENARKNGVMVGIRFRYDDKGDENLEPEWDNLVQMLLDVEANGVLEDYADIITWCEIGTLGAYGEQWGTRYGDWGYSDELIDLYLKILPEEIDLLHRSPSKLWHWVNFKLGTSYGASTVQNMVAEVNSTYANVVNNKHDYVSGDGKDFSSGNLVKDDLKRLGIFNDGYMGTNWDYGTYSNRANETAFLSQQVDVPYGGEFSGDRYLQIYYVDYTNVWYPINAIPEMYYTNLAYLHGGPWSEREGDTIEFSTEADKDTFIERYTHVANELGRSELVDQLVVEELTEETANEDGTTTTSIVGYKVTYTAFGYDKVPFTEAMEIASEEKIGATLDLSEYYGLSSQKFIYDHMGYRFIVRDSDMTGTATPGATFEYDIDIENTGFFKIDKEKEVELLFVNGGSSFTTTIANVDVRDWDAGTNNLSGTVTLPENMAGGQWQVYLRISPVNENAEDDTTYGVKFANAGIYNADLGANLVGAVTVDSDQTSAEAFDDGRMTGAYYDDPTSYPADTEYLDLMDGSYTFTEAGHSGFTILFKLEGIAEGSEINLTRWDTNGSGGQLHSFNYFFKNNATYGYGKTLTENGYYMIFSPFASLGSHYGAYSEVGKPTYDYFRFNAVGTGREDKDTPTSLNGNDAVITPLGFVEGAVTGYKVYVRRPGETTKLFEGTYSFKNTDNPKATENVQFLQATTIASIVEGLEPADYVDENGIPYKFIGWTTQDGFKQGLLDEHQLAMGTMNLYPYYEPDFSASAARLNGLVKTVTDGVDADGIFYTLDADTRTALVGTGSDWYGNAGFTGNDAILPAYLNVDGVIYTVTGIADNAFARCTALSNVYIPQTYSDISASAFAGVEDNITVYASAIDTYLDYADVLGAAQAQGIATAELTSEGECVVVFGSEEGEIWQVSVQSADNNPVYDGEIADRDGDETYCYYAFTGWSAEAPYTSDCFVYPVYEGTGHVAGDKVYESEGKCGESVAYTVSCASCGTPMENGSEVLKDHEYGEYVSDGNATCTEDGTKTASCGICGDTDTVADEGSALGHSFVDYVSDGNASCGVDGTKTAKCEHCDETETLADEGSALTHNYVWNITTQPTFGVSGVKTGVCEHCGDTKTEEIPALTKGDVNGDNALNVIDMTLIARYIAQQGLNGTFDLSDCNVDAMDYNGDGVVDQLDLNFIGLAVIAQ